MTTTTTIKQIEKALLAATKKELGKDVKHVESKNYSRLCLGAMTLCYINPKPKKELIELAIPTGEPNSFHKPEVAGEKDIPQAVELIVKSHELRSEKAEAREAEKAERAAQKAAKEAAEAAAAQETAEAPEASEATPAEGTPSEEPTEAEAAPAKPKRQRRATARKAVAAAA